MHARLLESQSQQHQQQQHKLVKPTVIQQNGMMPPFYSLFSADALLGQSGLPFNLTQPTPRVSTGSSAPPGYPVASISSQALVGQGNIDAQATIEAPLFGLESRIEEPDEQGVISALDLQMKNKDCIGGYVERDLEVFIVSWAGPKIKMECSEEVSIFPFVFYDNSQCGRHTIVKACFSNEIRGVEKNDYVL